MKTNELIRIFKDLPDLMEALAGLFFQKGRETLKEKDKFVVALSGGNSPKSLYPYLILEKNKDKLDWRKVFFFFVDERNVPFENADSNAGEANEDLFQPLGISNKNFFPVNTLLSPKEAAKEYEEQIISFFQNQEISFDFIFLGLGDNAHTASLFPKTEILKEEKPGVKAVFVQELNSYRISFTASLINQAKTAAFLVFGKKKSKAVQHVLKSDFSPNLYPAQLIKLKEGQLFWFLDEAAASDLETSQNAT